MVRNALFGRMVGKFVLRDQLGIGGFGTVYRCDQPHLLRQAVIKVLHERRGESDVDRARFLREAQLASRLNHRYSAHIYDYGAEHDGLLWIAMELVDGITLAEWLKTYGPMPPEQFVPFFKKLLEVVQVAHALGIVHRDLKPANIMVEEEEGGVLVPKLLDLGIAKLEPELATPAGWPDGSLGENQEPADEPGTGGPLTHSGVGLGSAGYMSPEQWRDPRTVGASSDIYALGVVAYEALTGRLPFPAETRERFCMLHCHAEMPSLGHELAPVFDGVMRRALAKYPEGRQASARELAAELRQALQASGREQLRASAQQWQTGARAPGLLWGADMLERFEAWTTTTFWSALTDVEVAFLAASQRRARRSRWRNRLLVTLALVIAIGVPLVKMWVAQQRADFAEQTVIQGEVEQGRQALHEGTQEARVHLAEAYRRGSRTSDVKFMFARAVDPRLAELARMSSTSGRMWSTAFAPDGTTFVTTDDAAAQLWDATSFQRLFVMPHGDTVFDAAYSRDGHTLFTASGDGTVGVWDVAHKVLIRKLSREGQKARYYLLATSPDGSLVAAIDPTGRIVHVWSAGTGALVADLRTDAAGHPGIAFSADSRWLVATGGEAVHVFDAQTWSVVLTIPHAHRMALDPTGPRVVAGSSTGDVSIWDLPSGTRIRRLRESGESIDRVVFSPDGHLVVTATADGAAQIWNTATGGLQRQFSARRSKILAVEFDSASKLLLSAGFDGSVAIADIGLGMVIAVLDGPQGMARVAHFDPSSQRVVAASWDGTARVWSAAATYLRWSSASISDDCEGGPGPDRRFVAVVCRGQTYVWDTASDQLLARLPGVLPIEGDWAPAVPVVASAGDLAAIPRGDQVELHAVPSGRLIRVIAHRAAVTAVAFAADGHDLVSGDSSGALVITRDGQSSISLPGLSRGIDTVGFLPGGRVMAADDGKRLRIYAPNTWVLLGELLVPSRVGSLRPSLDGLRLITLPSSDIPSQAVKTAAPVLWDVVRYRSIALLHDHPSHLFSARFVAGDHEIVTAGNDGVAQLWDGWTGHHLQTYRGSFRYLADAMLTPDGSMVVSAGGDGVVRFWDRASGRPLWAMPAYRSPVMGIHWQGGHLITRGIRGEISRWSFPAPDQVIEAGARLALSCRHAEAHPPEACTSP